MDPGVPGVLMRMAALAPPYMAPQNTPPSPISAMSGGMEKVKGHGRYGGDAGKHTADDADDEPDEHHQQIHGEHGARRAPHNILKHGRDCIHRTSLRKEGGPGSGPKPLRRAGYLLCVF